MNIISGRWIPVASKWLSDSPALAFIVAVADVVAKLAVFYTIVTYLLEASDRQKIKEFQAWQVINTARAGDGGRKAGPTRFDYR